MTVGPVSSSMATVLMGLQSAQRQSVEAVSRITTPGLAAPQDSAEFSSAALAAQSEQMLDDVLDLRAAHTQTKAMGLVARSFVKNTGTLLDVLG